MSIPPSDASIPVLTQIIAEPGEAVSIRQQPLAATSVSARNSGDDERWKRLELKLNERVLRQILRRVDFVIEHRVKEALADVLQQATEDMVKEIRRGLHVTLEDVIKRAVAQEIATVQAIKE